MQFSFFSYGWEAFITSSGTLTLNMHSLLLMDLILGGLLLNSLSELYRATWETLLSSSWWATVSVERLSMKSWIEFCIADPKMSCFAGTPIIPTLTRCKKTNILKSAPNKHIANKSMHWAYYSIHCARDCLCSKLSLKSLLSAKLRDTEVNKTQPLLLEQLWSTAEETKSNVRVGYGS